MLDPDQSPIPDPNIFDDASVAENICSGIDIETEHKQNLQALVLGAAGVRVGRRAIAPGVLVIPALMSHDDIDTLTSRRQES
jgi:hypothetical protein